MVNVEQIEKLRLSEVMVSGLSLPELHERYLEKALGDEKPKIINGDQWLMKYPLGARDYYVDLFLGLHGNYVLVEDFKTDDDDELRFYAEVVRPAFHTAKKITGAPPNVMRLIPGRFTNSPLWYAYPDHYRAHLAALGVNL